MTTEEKRQRIERQRQQFYDMLVPYVAQYGREMVRDFYDYWTELNRSQTRMRFEMEKTWETAKRLSFWSRHSNKSRYENKTNRNREDRVRAYAEVAADFRRRSGIDQ